MGRRTSGPGGGQVINGNDDDQYNKREHLKEAEQSRKIAEHPNDDDDEYDEGDNDDDLKEAVAKQSCKVGEHPDDDDVDVPDRVGDGAGEDEEGERGEHSNCHLKFGCNNNNNNNMENEQ